MAATFNWTVGQLDRNLADGGVTVAHWRCIDADKTPTTGTGVPW